MTSRFFDRHEGGVDWKGKKKLRENANLDSSVAVFSCTLFDWKKATKPALLKKLLREIDK
ncbi:MAG: hypothetical protein KI791_09280 [Cyclobacteriaceae bacterium]|nr:hypothetical protein [Cyclobacteriaceae bacterium SS2]